MDLLITGFLGTLEEQDTLLMRSLKDRSILLMGSLKANLVEM